MIGIFLFFFAAAAAAVERRLRVKIMFFSAVSNPMMIPMMMVKTHKHSAVSTHFRCCWCVINRGHRQRLPSVCCNVDDDGPQLFCVRACHTGKHFFSSRKRVCFLSHGGESRRPPRSNGCARRVHV
uniref:Putative secreted protein n=1 Tax=Anopheles darlingi TaxID=43151 RepID=A0A2M4D5Q1_ANODA